MKKYNAKTNDKTVINLINQYLNSTTLFEFPIIRISSFLLAADAAILPTIPGVPSMIFSMLRTAVDTGIVWLCLEPAFTSSSNWSMVSVFLPAIISTWPGDANSGIGIPMHQAAKLNNGVGSTRIISKNHRPAPNENISSKEGAHAPPRAASNKLCIQRKDFLFVIE